MRPDGGYRAARIPERQRGQICPDARCKRVATYLVDGEAFCATHGAFAALKILKGMKR